jgi:plasmid stability protein
MAVNISIKNVPDELAERLRSQAAQHHRSLQGHLLAILEEAAGENERVTPEDILRRVQELKVQTAAESVSMVRSDRDAR